MKLLTSRQPNKERLKATLLHENPSEIPYWEAAIGKRNLAFLFGREDVPELSWLVSPEEQLQIATATGQDVVTLWMFGPAPRVREPNGSLRCLEDGELTTWDQLDKIVPYTDEEIRAFVKPIERVFDVVAGTGVGVSVACGGSIWQKAWQLVGFEEFMSKTLTDPAFVERLIHHTAEPGVRAAKLLCEYPLTFLMVADNISTTKGPFVSPDTLKSLWRPWAEKTIAPAKAKGIPAMLNTDGKIDWILDDIVEMGFDAINPVDPNGNDIFEVKELYGDRLCLVGGINQHWPLSTGTPADVDRTVREYIDRLRGGGGYVVSSSHDIGENVVPANWVAMIQAVERYS